MQAVDSFDKIKDEREDDRIWIMNEVKKSMEKMGIPERLIQ